MRYQLLALLTGLAIACCQATALAEPVMPLKQLDGGTRAKALAALAGLIILGFGMIALVWLGARVVQRYRHSSPCLRPTPRPGEHDWASKPLVEKEPELPES